jgi:cyclase
MPRAIFRLFVAAFLSSLLALAWRSAAGPAAGGLTEIVPGVWFYQGDLGRDGFCNNVIIEMADQLIVVDANFPAGARAVLEQARRVSSKPVKIVFDTHHHGDHAYGNAVWTRMGAVTVAFQPVGEEMKRVEPGRWSDAAKTRSDLAGLGVDGPELPKRLLSGNRERLSDGKREVQFLFFGWAHTRGDGFVYLPKDKVLATGDAVVNGPYNFTGDGSITNWPRVIQKAQKLDVRHVLPGHGPPGGPEMMARQAQFFVELRAAVAKAIAAGRKLEDLVPAAAGGKPAQPAIQLSPEVQTYVSPTGLAAQVKDAYREITGNR